MKSSSAQLYESNDELPHKPRRLTFKRKTSDFTITLTYDDAAIADLPEGEDRLIGKYTIKVPPLSNENIIPDIRITFNIDKHGCVYIQSAQSMEEYIVHEPVVAPTPLATSADGTQVEGAPTTSVEGETVAKKKYKKTELEVISDIFILSKEDLKHALELEASMAHEDRVITETADKRNELESYLYSMRDKLDGALKVCIYVDCVYD